MSKNPKKRKLDAEEDKGEPKKKRVKVSFGELKDVELTPEKLKIMEKLVMGLFKNEKKVENFAKELTSEKKVGFSSLNTDDAVEKTFGFYWKELIDTWKFDFSKIGEMEGLDKACKEILKRRTDELEELKLVGNEGAATSYIDDVIRVGILEKKDIRLEKQFKIKGKMTHGLLDYALLKDSVVMIIIEAKGKEFGEGVNQLLHQLKALGEKYEGTKQERKIYYGFSATVTYWIPVKYTVKGGDEWREKMKIGKIFSVIREEDLKQIVYLLNTILKD